MVPDKEGKLANVIQGHDNIQEVIASPEPYLSTLIGRYGNRIAKGRFQLNGKEYKLAIIMVLTLCMEVRRALTQRYGMQYKLTTMPLF